jgi:hypothetical protein
LAERPCAKKQACEQPGNAFYIAQITFYHVEILYWLSNYQQIR